MRSRSILYMLITLLFVLAGCGNASTTQQQPNVQSPATATQGSSASTPTVLLSPTPSPTAIQPVFQVKHIFWIMMENHDASQIFGNTADAPYLNQLANSYGMATRYFGVTHPSLPNYLALISGSFQDVFDDCVAGAVCSGVAHMFGGETLVDQLEAHTFTWKAYMQGLPATGYTGGYAGLYGQKHDPFMCFSTIRNSAARMQRIVPLTQLNADIASGALPNFVWISPDVCHDMHGASGSGIAGCDTYDGEIALGDAFVRALVPQIMQSSAWNEGSAIVITWDEGNSSAGCCKGPAGNGGGNVPLIVLTSQGPRHIVSNTDYNHYSLLGTIEQLWELGCLANTCGMGQGELLLPLFQ